MMNRLKQLWYRLRSCPICGQRGNPPRTACARCGYNWAAETRELTALQLRLDAVCPPRDYVPTPALVGSLSYYRVDLRTDESDLRTARLYRGLHALGRQAPSPAGPAPVREMQAFPIIPPTPETKQ